MFKRITEENINVTPRLAESLLELNTLGFQRKLNISHAKQLASEIDRGEFLVGDISVAILDYNGRQKVLVNGQHQCTAVVSTGKPITAWFSEYIVHNQTELSLLYRKFDNHKERSLNAILRPEAHSLGIQWPTRIVSLVVTGATIIEGKTCIDKQDKVPLLKKYRLAGDFVDSIIIAENNGSLHLRRGPVVAAMMLAWMKNRDDAVHFWTDVRDGEGLRKKQPAYLLREYLTRTSTVGGRFSPTSKTLATRHEMLVKCILAWNAFRKNLPTNLAYRADKPVPKAV